MTQQPTGWEELQDKLIIFEPIIQEWITQGRSEEQIYGVRNFFTGVGGIKLLALLSQKDEEIKEARKEARMWSLGGMRKIIPVLITPLKKGKKK